MSLAEDIAGALAAEVYRRVGLVTTLCVGALDDGEPDDPKTPRIRFTEIHQNAINAALVAAFDGTEATLVGMLEVDAGIRTGRLEVPDA